MSMKPLKQFVPSSVCLDCDGCCQFDQAQTDWRAKLGMDEQDALDVVRQTDHDGYLKTCRHGEKHCCVFFNPNDHTCQVYDRRPFDCRLYPFVLSSVPEGIGVFMHLSCPYIQTMMHTQDLEAYVAYLKRYFDDHDTQLFLLKNPEVVHDYRHYLSELQHVFTLKQFVVDVDGGIERQP